MERHDGSMAQERQLMTGAQALVRALEDVGVTDIFGMPGGAILPFYDPLFASEKIRHVLVRHEQGAGHAAEGYAMVTGRVGVCVATSGPGATNLITAIGDAHMDSVPMVAITGQVGTRAIGTDAFQEADIVGATMPFVKHSFLVTSPDEVAARVFEAFHLASTGRPGPVLIDVTKNAQEDKTHYVRPESLDLPGYALPGKPNQRRVAQAAEVIASCERPVFYLGGGLSRAGVGVQELRELIELVGAPFVTTLTALDIMPTDHPLNLGMPGMHGTVAAVGALQRADLVICLGARFDDRVTGKPDTFARHASVIHVDIDPAEISKIREADVPIVGDLKDVVPALSSACRDQFAAEPRVEIDQWLTEVAHTKATYPTSWTDTDDGLLQPQEVITHLARLAPEDTVWVTGVGQHQMWSAHYLEFNQPHSWLTSAGAGTMGYGVPAAMGAKVGAPQRPVWLIDGDGCFQMTNQELATCTLNEIPIKVALINNSSLGMVRQWQTLFYGQRYSNTDLHTGAGTERVPDFVTLAQAYGAVGLRCERLEDVDDVIAQANAINDRPVVIDFICSADSQVWPMVAAGVSNDDIQYAKGMSPTWEEE
ncbi:MAG: Acetolactate synthase [Actinomyces urogenitalis DORA_12]|jgi:acetolactate synthase-1/2/3 large subunit|uniref:Acetolactate synthase n=1 Tax=Actinomyces urogenitalis DORA_12 TaxID=1403939 RepID=W1V756_9ACTO|nr:acetolactate synthase large subunit [Actinomyces urogenitalis]ETJ01491.1 MAG: Acetolactate synthase [Actinomyces urogenitalis DORA_12]MBS6072491.1 acetolactate synthase large subunit [Actinomyces urogenitalis]MDU7427972.1 acetolactate synthase large subunit [Actinomyces urogenitalis]